MDVNIINKKESILNATLELITVRGFDQTPMSMIAKQAKVAAGTIYIYFKCKEDIITELYLITKTELTEYITNSVNTELSSRESLDSIIKKYIQFMLDYPQKFKYIEQFFNSPYFDKMIESECLRIFDPMIKFIQKAIDERLIKDFSMPFFHSFVFSPLNSLINMHLRNSFVIDDDSTEIICQTIWDAIKR